MKILLWKFLCWAVRRLFFKCPDCGEFTFDLKVRRIYGTQGRRICDRCDKDLFF